MNLYIDIETIPTDRADVRDWIAGGVSHPAVMSKPETIAKWVVESKPAAVDEAIRKTGLDGAFGRACVIGWAIDDGEVRVIASATDERSLLTQFAEAINISHHHALDVCVIGHNVAAFDLRFLLHRYIVNRIVPPVILRIAANAKPWDTSRVFDTMTQWDPSRERRASLDKLCMALGIPSPKSDITGATVWDAVQAGRINDVADYCRQDVEAVRAIHQRMSEFA